MNDLSPEARLLLARARESIEPSGVDRERGRVAVRAALASAAVPTVVAAATPVAAMVKTGAIALAIVTAVGVTAYRRSNMRSAPALPAVEAQVAEPTPAAAAPVFAPEPSPEPARVEPAPIAMPAGTTVARATPLPAKRALSARPEPTVPSADDPTAPATDTLSEEIASMEQVEHALSSHQPARARALLDAMKGRFPHGVLIEERMAARVVAQCALGQSEQARAAADAFLRAHPRSPQAARVRAACGAATQR
jgi:hypothetical protein